MLDALCIVDIVIGNQSIINDDVQDRKSILAIMLYEISRNIIIYKMKI